jgi:SAM-dependent methyltransferase
MSAASVHADNAAQAEYWNANAGQKWTEHQEHQDQVLRPVSDRLIAVAKPKAGERVIDVGCGCGATTIAFAEHVKPDGAVLGLDVSEPMLARARERAGQDLPITLALADATVHNVTSNAADLVVSRFGVMFFADPAKSFANLRRGLKPGGRLVFACWRRVLSDAGFADIALEPHDLELDIAVGRGLDTAVRASMTIGPTSRMLDGQSEAVRAAATADIRKALAAHARGESVPLGAAIWIVTARNPG